MLSAPFGEHSISQPTPELLPHMDAGRAKRAALDRAGRAPQGRSALHRVGIGPGRPMHTARHGSAPRQIRPGHVRHGQAHGNSRSAGELVLN
ncbi:MAG TPA: hypothetical protein VN306_02190 [Mycobacterium sp.]|nr:hypothetical protein [Mycobacterium sp.]